MRFVLLETLCKDDITSIFSFLGVNTEFDIGELNKYNVGGKPRSKLLTKLFYRSVGYIPFISSFLDNLFNIKRGYYPPMKKKTRRFLTDYFEELNKEFERFTGLNIDSWRNEAE